MFVRRNSPLKKSCPFSLLYLLTQLFISVWALGYLVYSLDYGVLVIVDLAAQMSRIWLPEAPCSRLLCLCSVSPSFERFVTFWQHGMVTRFQPQGLVFVLAPRGPGPSMGGRARKQGPAAVRSRPPWPWWLLGPFGARPSARRLRLSMVLVPGFPPLTWNGFLRHVTHRKFTYLPSPRNPSRLV